jgi:hypothetical protein
MKYVIKAEEALLKQTGKLTSHPHIFCVKCQGKTTAFGTNLQGKIKKAGGLEQLLTSFECRTCRNAGKTPRLPRAPKRNRKASRESRKEDLLRNLPKMNFTRPEPVVLVQNPEFAAQVTAHACQRPDVFLDSNRSCDFCALYEVCRAPNRRLSSQGWQAQRKLAA